MLLTLSDKFIKIFPELAKTGYIWYEELIVNNKIEKHEIVNHIGDNRLKNALTV